MYPAQSVIDITENIDDNIFISHNRCFIYNLDAYNLVWRVFVTTLTCTINNDLAV